MENMENVHSLIMNIFVFVVFLFKIQSVYVFYEQLCNSGTVYNPACWYVRLTFYLDDEEHDDDEGGAARQHAEDEEEGPSSAQRLHNVRLGDLETRKPIQ